MAHVPAHGTHDSGVHAHDAHGDAHAHVDGDDLPAHGIVLEEPRSPAWLPYLGAALLALVLVWWLAMPSDADEARAAAAAASASASASAGAEAAPAPTPSPAVPPAGAPVPPRPVRPQLPPQAIVH